MKKLQWSVLILGVLCIVGMIWFAFQAKNYDNDKQIEFVNLKPADLSTLDVKIPRIDIDNKTVEEAFRELMLLWKKELPDKVLPKIVFIGIPRKDQRIDVVIAHKTVLKCIASMCLSSKMKYCIQDGNIILQSKGRNHIEGQGTISFVFPKELIQHLGIDKKFSEKVIVDFFEKYGIKVHEASKDESFHCLDNCIMLKASYTDLEKISFLLYRGKKPWKDDLQGCKNTAVPPLSNELLSFAKYFRTTRPCDRDIGDKQTEMLYRELKGMKKEAIINLLGEPTSRDDKHNKYCKDRSSISYEMAPAFIMPFYLYFGFDKDNKLSRIETRD